MDELEPADAYDEGMDVLEPLTTMLAEKVRDLIAAHDAHVEHSINLFGLHVARLIVDGKVHDSLTDEFKPVFGVADAQSIYLSRVERMVGLWLRTQGIDTKALNAELREHAANT